MFCGFKYILLIFLVVGECFIVSTPYYVISYIPSPKCWDIKRQLSHNSSPCDFDYSVFLEFIHIILFLLYMCLQTVLTNDPK